MPTPRTADGGVGAESLGVLVDRAVSAGVDGIAVLGSSGGFAYLDRAQRRTVVDAAAEAVDGRVPVLAGIGALTTRAVLEHADDASRADALLLGTSAYLPLTPDEVVGLYRDVTAHAARPVWAYHNPRTTGVEMSTETLARIAALDGIGGFKDRGTDAADLRRRYDAHRAAVPDDVEIGFSGDALGVEGLLVGARTWHCGLAGIIPEPFVAIAAAAVAGDRAGALAAVERLRPWTDLAATWGAARLAAVVGPLLGIEMGDLPRPLLMPPPGVRDQVAARLEDLTVLRA
nr:dihydrodipicolinate synthase family protein [Cellulomonas sp. JH27-2]